MQRHEEGRSMMDGQQRAVAEFYARLASIPSLEALREGERLLLREDLAGLAWLSPWPADSEQERARQARNKAEFQHAVKSSEVWRQGLEDIHQHARTLLWKLLDGQTVLTPSLTSPRLALRLDREGRIDAGPGPQGIEMQSPIDRLTMGLLMLLRPHQPFPFRRCPVCQTVFVPVKRQKFCSPNCTYISTESKRKEEKREYMREYMANRRKKLKKTGQKRKEK
jgi:predicted nucleic acid-binding Zn ribbon protein